jgi:hypothetical protein
MHCLTGYAARQLHQKKVEARLDTIEHVVSMGVPLYQFSLFNILAYFVGPS